MGQGGGNPGEKEAGGVREAEAEGLGSRIPKVAGSRRNMEKLCKIAQYFAIYKMQRGGSQRNMAAPRLEKIIKIYLTKLVGSNQM